MSKLSKFLTLLRPKQWIKNVLLFAAPFGAGIVPTENEYILLGKSFVVFCLISSIGYVINDWIDRESDRTHLKKKFRPFASRSISGTECVGTLLLLGALASFLSYNLPANFHICAISYLAVTVSYSTFVKKIAVFELIWVSLGFLIRTLAGASVVGVFVSQWFLIVASFGSLFIITTKRLAEFRLYQTDSSRKVLREYSEGFLESVITLSVAVTLTCYALWAFDVASGNEWARISLLPVTVGILRYFLHTEKVTSENPENSLFNDRLVPVSGAITLLCLILAVYVG